MIIITPGLLAIIFLSLAFVPPVVAALEAIAESRRNKPPKQSDGIGGAMMLFLLVFGVGVMLVVLLARLRGVPIH
jgi:amino acid permease